MYIIIPFIILLASIFTIRFFLKKKKSDRRNYSLGLEAAKAIQTLLKNEKYVETETQIQNQDINDITQIVDHLALSLEETELLKWNDLKQSDFSKLSLGVFYLHKAWIARSHQKADDISENKAVSFFDYLNLSEQSFNSISENAPLRAETDSRRIRLYMSLENNALASEYFFKASKNNPNFLWPFIHYTEMIQPKWGGEIKTVETFYESLPDDFLIRSIVVLKLIHDSKNMNDNYFSKYQQNLNIFANEKIKEIDSALNDNKLNSIHKYVLYNYMWSVSSKINKKDFIKKYEKLMAGNYTIYPCGLLQ